MKDERGSHAKPVGPSHSNGKVTTDRPQIDLKVIAERAAGLKRFVYVFVVAALVIGMCGVIVAQRRMAADAAPQDRAQTGGTLSGEEYAKMDAKRRRESREIVCWGDSMTSGFGASEAHIDSTFTFSVPSGAGPFQSEQEGQCPGQPSVYADSWSPP